MPSMYKTFVVIFTPFWVVAFAVGAFIGACWIGFYGGWMLLTSEEASHD